jgi:hypothetical protein
MSTGGELNKLNHKYGCSRGNRTVPVMKLIKNHRPSSREELVELIEYHIDGNCECGVVAKGGLCDFTNILYEAQIQEWGEYRYTFEQCYAWVFELFITNSLKGASAEYKARDILSQYLKGFKVSLTTGVIDSEMRVDLIISLNDYIVCGIQVKPTSYRYCDTTIKQGNIDVNDRFGHPVFYFYFDNNMEFVNTTDILYSIREIVKK